MSPAARTTRLLGIAAVLLCLPHVARAQPAPAPVDDAGIPEASDAEGGAPQDAPDATADAPTPEPTPAPEQTETRATPAPTSAPAPRTAPAARRVTPAGGSVEDVALEELLGLEMDERLGTTEAASRTAEDLLSAPATVTLIEHDEIRRSAARTIPDLLRLVPGVQVYQSAPGVFTVALRGAAGVTGNNVVVTIDGIPIASAVDGSIPWEAMPISVRDVERVEVVRGPVSTIYGANAYTGVINVVTYRGFGHEPVGAARVEVGTDANFRLRTGVSARYVHADRRVQQAWFASMLYDDVHSQRLGEDAAEVVSGSALGRLGVTLDAGQLDLEVSLATVRASEVEHLVPDPRATPTLHSFAQARFVSADGPGVLGRVGLWVRERSLARYGGLSTRDDDAQNFDYVGTRALRASAGFDLPLELHDTFTLGVGAQIDLDRIRAPYFQPSDGETLYLGSGAYVQAAWDPNDHWAIRGALRADIPPVSGDVALSYRGSIAYRGEEIGVRLSGASAFRAPTYVEAGARFVDGSTGLVLLEGQPGLDGPRNDSAEVALTWSPSARFHGVVVGYYTRLTNVMIEDFATTVRRTFVTDEHARHLVGGELEGTLEPLDTFDVSFGLGVLAFVGDSDDDVATIAVPDQNATLVASVRAHGTALAERFGWGASVALATGRTYTALFGIPPTLRAAWDVPVTAQLGLMAEYEVSVRVPLFVSLRIESNLPHPIESPYLGASRIGTAATLGLEYRRD